MIDTSGIFAVWKPKGPTSNDIVQQIKRITGQKKVGHAGTLDPLAEGILVIAIGREATKQLSVVVAKEKEYRAMIQLGLESTTDDAEGEKTIVNENPPAGGPTQDEVERVLKKFVGDILQTPPIYSAIKVQGKEAYKLARKGAAVTLKPRRVLIKKIILISYEWPLLIIDVITGPGVYVRSLARDIGRELGVGGYLGGLVRTRVGEYTKEKCAGLADLKKISN